METNKKILLGAGLGALSATVAGIWWLKKQIPLKPREPVTDENTVLLYQYTYSPFCIKVAKIMDYKGIPYKIVNLLPMIHKGYMKEISGQNLVPVVKHKGRFLHDSSVIAKYFEDLFPEPSIFYKDDKKLNHEVLLWEDWADESLEPTFGSLAYLYLYEHSEVFAENDEYNTGIPFVDKNKGAIGPFVIKSRIKNEGLDLGKKDILKKRARENLDILSERLEKSKYLVGDKLTLANITVASHLTVAEKVPYIYEDDMYSHIFEWQREIFDATKRRYATSVSS